MQPDLLQRPKPEPPFKLNLNRPTKITDAKMDSWYRTAAGRLQLKALQQTVAAGIIVF